MVWARGLGTSEASEEGAHAHRDVDGAVGELDVAEAKRTCGAREARAALETVARKAAATPPLAGRRVDTALFVMRRKGRIDDPRVIDARTVLDALR